MAATSSMVPPQRAMIPGLLGPSQGMLGAQRSASTDARQFSPELALPRPATAMGQRSLAPRTKCQRGSGRGRFLTPINAGPAPVGYKTLQIVGSTGCEPTATALFSSCPRGDEGLLLIQVKARLEAVGRRRSRSAMVRSLSQRAPSAPGSRPPPAATCAGAWTLARRSASISSVAAARRAAG